MCSPVLAAPSFDRPLNLAVDASDTGVGAVLLQVGGDGVDHPLLYFSKKLDRHQKWYSTSEHFEVYVGSACAPVVVFTDHNPLVFLHRMRNKNRRLMNWSLRLQGFDIDIRHIRGKDNVLAALADVIWPKFCSPSAIVQCFLVGVPVGFRDPALNRGSREPL